MRVETEEKQMPKMIGTTIDLRTFFNKEIMVQLRESVAFTSMAEFIEKIPYDKVGIRPKPLPYSFFEVFSHIVQTQQDLMDFTMASAYHPVEWPAGVWPGKAAPDNEQEWKGLKARFFRQHDELEKFLAADHTALDALVKHADQDHQTLLRELLLMVSHYAYHTGQLYVIARLLGAVK